MKKDKQQPEKGQLTNEEYLNLYGSKDNMYLKARITTNEYFKLPEDKRRFYMRFCGHNEVYYTLNPMTSPFPVTLPKIENQAPLSNETKVAESTYSRGENESLEDWKMRLDKICLTPEFKDCQLIIENQSPSCYPDIALLMLEYASQFKNTDAVKVITDRIAKLENKTNILGFYSLETEYSLKTLHNILKIIQP